MERPAALEPALVQEFVGNAHGNLARVQELLAQQPALVNAAWDWGGGDFETALGAAAHMGRADIARLLLRSGARLDLFAAAMLGELALVQAALSAHPASLHVPGPHGISLLAHAEAGGEAAAPVAAYLRSLS
jgi:ankyrin repeat protein